MHTTLIHSDHHVQTATLMRAMKYLLPGLLAGLAIYEFSTIQWVLTGLLFGMGLAVADRLAKLRHSDFSSPGIKPGEKLHDGGSFRTSVHESQQAPIAGRRIVCDGGSFERTPMKLF